MYFNHYDDEVTNELLDESDSFGVESCCKPDSLFGIGNPKKKAERKLRKAEKALAKGRVKKAERKLKKAQPILNKIQQTQQATLSAKNQLADINRTTGVIAATDPAQTESLSTTAGQLGTEAGSITYPSNVAAKGTMTSSNGDIGGGGGGGGFMEDIESTTTPETGLTPQTAKELQGVTVTSKKNNMVMYIIIATVILAAIFLLPKLLKGKK